MKDPYKVIRETLAGNVGAILFLAGLSGVIKSMFFKEDAEKNMKIAILGALIIVATIIKEEVSGA